MNDIVKVKVMTYNMRHGEGKDGHTDLPRLADEIAQAHVDVVTLQGVDRFMPRSGFQNQLKRLAKRLKMNACFSPSVNLLVLQYGNAILSRFPIISSNIRYLGGSIERRSILTARLQVEGQKLTVLNTHLGVHPKERKKQLLVLREAIDKLDRPAIIAGDFNLEIGDPLMKPFDSNLQKIMLQDKHPTMTGVGEIDHIFVNMPIEQASAWVQPSIASDHYPVIAELHWKPVYSS